MEDFNAGCVIGIIVLAVVAAILYVVYLLVSAYWEIFLGGGIVLGILITWLSIKAAKSRKLKAERKRVAYENSPEGKFNIAIEKSVAKKKEQENTLQELFILEKEKLDQIYVKFNEPQDGENLIFEFKGRQRFKKDVELFERLYKDKIQDEVREGKIRFPDKTDFEIKYAITNRYEDMYFKPGFYYEDKYKEGIYEETIQEVKMLIKDNRNQIEICEKMIEYYNTLEIQLKETKQNYRASESARATGKRVDKIVQKSISDNVELQRAQEEAEYNEIVYKEYMKLTSEFKDTLTGSLQEVIKKDLDQASADFKKEMDENER